MDIMGLGKEHLEYFFEMFELEGYKRFDALKMCELGNQRIGIGGMEYLKSNGMPPYVTGKELFTHVGFEHTSIDINGKDGALPIDLTKPILDPDLCLNFDVITNSGTTEHVLDQIECFKNIHNMCKIGGLFIHVVPSIKYKTLTMRTGIVTAHGRYNYGFNFFRELAISCGYDILDERIIGRSVSVTMQKISNRPFVLDRALPVYIVDGSGQ